MLATPIFASSARITSILLAGELSASISSAMRAGLSMSLQLPCEGVAAAQRLELRVAERDRLGHRPGLLAQRDGAGVARHVVEVGAMEAGEALQAVERAGALEGLGVQLERVQRGVAAGAAARVLLQVRDMRRAIGAEEEAVAAGGGRAHQRKPVLL